MDVILDSNAYLSDIRMESIKFKNLFDYLRRTKSTLVVPRLVREETIGQYKYQLENQSKKTASVVKELNRLAVDKKSLVSFKTPDVKSAARVLRERLGQPAKGISVRYYPETHGVDVSDVFLRGVNRRRPANNDGEELRDVIIWLITLQYAETEKKPVALVTADAGFWNDANIHDHISGDIKERNVDVSLFRTVEDFVKASAPAAVSVDAGYVSKFFDVTNLMPDLSAAARKALAGHGLVWGQQHNVRTVRPSTAQFSAGASYEINPETKLLELVYELTFIANISVTEWRFHQPQIWGTGVLESYPAGGRFLGFAKPEVPFQGFANPVNPQSPNTIFANPNWNWSPLAQFIKPEAPQEERTTLKDYLVYAKAQISVRLVNETLADAELDGLEISKAEEMAEAEPTAEEFDVEVEEAAEAAQVEPEQAIESAPSGDSPDEANDSPKAK
jgi:hypothetical protein